MKAGVLTVSDRCARGEQDDLSGAVLAECLAGYGFDVVHRSVVPDDADLIAEALKQWSGDCALIVTTGGTGLAPRDVTPEATRSVIEREAPGLAEMLRWTGYAREPRAVLSRGVAGVVGRTLIVNLPGSQKAVREGMDALGPLLPHALAILLERPAGH